MNIPAVCAGLALALLSACAAVPALPTIQNAETVSILVTRTEKPDARIAIRNEAIGNGATAGVGTGLVAGGLWGLVCGPAAVLCVPLGAATGVVTGYAAGAVVGMTGALSEEKAARLRERLGRLQVSHPLAEELERNISRRAVKYWTLDAASAATVVSIEIQNLELMSTRDEQIRCAIRVLVSVRSSVNGRSKSSDKKPYEYLGAYSALSVWLDESSDFVDTSLSAASQQIAAQIVSDLSQR